MTFHDLNLRNPLYQFRNEMERLINGSWGSTVEEIVPPLFRVSQE